jgi:protein ImuB
MVRRLLPRPEPLPARPRDLRNDGWPSRDPATGPIVALHGPFTIAGGWWLTLGASPPRVEVHREYAFAETRRGDLLWIYHDRRRRRYLEEGRIE